MQAHQIRDAFLAYFKQHQHAVLPSAPVVPVQDETLLFTNAGMVPFKNCFLGLDTPKASRIASSQLCVRAGGKHNDLEQVGYTSRHHTLFEMLGNFSFGDYFKEEAIVLAWGFLTEVLKLPQDRLWITVYEEDRETAVLWRERCGVLEERLRFCGAEDNFWSMGDTGPCGPCTEIHYDHGDHLPGQPPGSGQEGERFVEIWNLVFMQFNRFADGRQEPLPRPSVDTGMGLERIAAVMQGVHNNYDTDLFQTITQGVAQVLGVSEIKTAPIRVMADHIRTAAFLLAEGIRPSNEGRGYVLRRIVRRAVRYGHQLGAEGPFFHQAVRYVVQAMGQAYPALATHETSMVKVLRAEEEQFFKTLHQGMRVLHDKLARLKGKTISGAMAFQLYDTYGFPLDLLLDVANEQGLSVDREGYLTCMEAQKARGRQASTFVHDMSFVPQEVIDTEFTGHQTCTEEHATVQALYGPQGPISTLSAGDSGWVVLDRTPFYAESGGQIGDRGALSNEQVLVAVHDTQMRGALHCHAVSVTQGALTVGAVLKAHVDEARRSETAANHSATHLLHAALKHVLGDGIAQKGSWVGPEALRFDFSHHQPVTPEQLDAVQLMVNQRILSGGEVATTLMPYSDALAQGAVALFGEKYGDQVRVLRMGGDFSVELCGGTHVRALSELGAFVVVEETAVASGVRRIEARTRGAAVAHMMSVAQQARQTAQMLHAPVPQLAQRAEQLVTRLKTLEKKVEHLEEAGARHAAEACLVHQHVCHGVPCVIADVGVVSGKNLRNMLSFLNDRVGGVVVLFSLHEERVHVVIGVAPSVSKRLSARSCLAAVLPCIEGKGGGKDNMAQASGLKVSGLGEALEAARACVTSALST